MDFYQRAKRYSIEKFTTNALSLLASASTENLIRLTYLAEKIPKKESYREKIRWIRTLFQSNHLGLAIARRVLSETHPHHRKKADLQLYRQINFWWAPTGEKPLRQQGDSIRRTPC